MDEEYVEIVLEEISDDCKRILATMQSTLRKLDAMIATLEKTPQDFANSIAIGMGDTNSLKGDSPRK